MRIKDVKIKGEDTQPEKEDIRPQEAGDTLSVPRAPTADGDRQTIPPAPPSSVQAGKAASGAGTGLSSEAGDAPKGHNAIGGTPKSPDEIDGTQHDAGQTKGTQDDAGEPDGIQEDLHQTRPASEDREEGQTAPSGRPKAKSRLRTLLIGAGVLAGLAILTGALALSGLFRPAADNSSSAAVGGPADGQSVLQSTSSGTVPTVTRSDRIIGGWVTVGVDFLTDGQDGVQAAAALDSAIDACKDYGCNTILFPVSQRTSAAAPEGGSFMERAMSWAHEKGMAFYAVADAGADDGGRLDLSRPDAVQRAADRLAALPAIKELDGILLEGCAYEEGQAAYADYMREGGGMGFENYRRDRLSAAMQRLTGVLREANGNLYIGLLADPIWAVSSAGEGGIELGAELSGSYAAGADTLGWMQKGYFDWIMVRATSTKDGQAPFQTVADWWNSKASGSFGLCFLHAADQVPAGAAGYENPDEILRQVLCLKDMPAAGSSFYTISALTGDGGGGAEALKKYLTGQLPEGYQPVDLTISSPAKQTLTTHESSIGFVGASDPLYPITLNGQEIQRTEAGYFSLQMDLNIGVNRFTFQHKGQSLTYTITYKQVLLREIAPAGDLTLDGGSVIMVKAVARLGSTVTARLGDASITLEPQLSDNPEETAAGSADFVTYLGTFSMPADLRRDTQMGRVSFTAHYNGQTETMTGGSITVRAGSMDDPGLPPFDSNGDGSENYINVGTGLIAEVSSYQIETFDGNIIDDRSRPTNNYLPKGTVDYCSRSTVMDAGSGYTYRVLRYGKRVYTTSKEKGDNIKVYEGTLPETNTITAAGVTEDQRFLTMTFDTAWKAPFRFKLSPQGYQDPYPSGGAPNYSISSPTFDHVDITFCYAATAQGKIELPADNPLFSSAEWIKNEADYTLRLHLKKAGGLYGWNAEYNSAGQLVFSFLKPVQLQAADNQYGVSLQGVKIVLDPGHGGSDPGAVGSNPQYTEAALNSILTYKVRDRLTALGAEVTLTKTDSERMGLDPRVRTVKEVKPDLFISFHRNSSTSVLSKGYESYYFNPFSEPLSRAIYKRNAGLYLDQRGNQWGNFYVMRVSDCPAILTENGFVSNADEYSLLVTDAFNESCADATVDGIVDYLKSIQQ